MTAFLTVLAAALAFVLYLLASAEGRRREVQARLEARDAEGLQLRAELDGIRDEQARALEAQLDRHARELCALRETHAASDKEAREPMRAALDEIARVRDQIALAEAARARVEAELQAARDNLASLDERLQASFTAVSRHALQANNEQFLQLAREALGTFQQAPRREPDKPQKAIHDSVKPGHASLG